MKINSPLILPSLPTLPLSLLAADVPSVMAQPVVVQSAPTNAAAPNPEAFDAR